MNRMLAFVSIILTFLQFAATGEDYVWPGVVEPEIPEYYVLDGCVVDGETGKPAAGVEVVWMNSHGVTGTLTSDSEGRVIAPLYDGLGWGSLLVALKGTKISPGISLRGESSLDSKLRLGEPASFSGSVTDETGAPVPNACLHLRIGHMLPSALLCEVRADAQGIYSHDGLPPGDYVLLLEHPQYYLPRGRGEREYLDLSLKPGERTVLDLTMKARTLYTGTVLGPEGEPVPNVNLSRPRESYMSSPYVFRSDEHGAFSVFAEAGQTISASDATFGIGSCKLPDPLEEDSDGIVITLGGMARVEGTVVGPAGEPIEDVRLLGTVTDSSGRFLSEPVPITSKGGIARISARPPVWKDAHHVLPTAPVYPMDTPDKPYYKEKSFSIKARHGETAEAKLILEPLQTRIIRGLVRDEGGNPAPNLPVHVYEGYAQADLWLANLFPFIPRPPERRPGIPYQTIEFGTPNAVLIARALSDKEGRWKTDVVTGSALEDWVRKADSPTTTRLTVVASDINSLRTAVERRELDDDATDVEIPLTLAATPDDLWMRVVVVDKARQPLAGVRWGIGGRGPFTTDEAGRLTIPRIGYRVDLKLVDEGYRVIAAETTGTIVEAPAPESDPAKDPIQSLAVSGFDWRPWGPGIGAEPPYIELQEQKVAFHYFDGKKGHLTITLESGEKNSSK